MLLCCVAARRSEPSPKIGILMTPHWVTPCSSNDPTFMNCYPCERCRYEAFKTIGEKKACFNEYLQLRAKEEKEESRSKAKQNRDAFFTLLELSPELRTGTRYSKAAALFDDEPRWKVLPGIPPSVICQFLILHPCFALVTVWQKGVVQ